jgi:hypothetical protein
LHALSNWKCSPGMSSTNKAQCPSIIPNVTPSFLHFPTGVVSVQCTSSTQVLFFLFLFRLDLQKDRPTSSNKSLSTTPILFVCRQDTQQLQKKKFSLLQLL